MLTPLPDPHRDANGIPTIFSCPTCSAINIGAPPHGEGAPCPIALELAAAKIASDNGTAMMAADVYAAFKRMGLMTGGDEE